MTHNVHLRPFQASISDALQVLDTLRTQEHLVQEAATLCLEAFERGNKILVCGNGGSASESQHLVGELMGRYNGNRAPLPAVAITADSTTLTCIGNDYRFEDVFSRQIIGLGRPGDIVIVFSTSGNSPNIVRALEVARDSRIRSIAFLGREGGAAARLSDFPLIVPCQDTARIQEGHQFLMHALMDFIEAKQAHD